MRAALLVVILVAGAAGLVYVLRVGRFRAPRSGAFVTRQDNPRLFWSAWLAGVLAYGYLLTTGLRYILR